MKVAIPVVPTVRVLITFTKFVDLQPPEEQFFTPFSSPRHFISSGDENDDYEVTVTETETEALRASVSVSSSATWLSRGGSRSGMLTNRVGPPHVADPFSVPIGYAWSSFDEKGKKMKKSKSMSRKSK